MKPTPKLFLSGFLITLVLSQVAISSRAQTASPRGSISGSVIDAATGEPLGFANVYINNTTLGTTSNAEGSFLISGIPFGAVELIVSFVGYESLSFSFDFQETADIGEPIKLKASEATLSEIEVNSKKDKKWEKQLSRFEKVFLGDTRFSTQCSILNPWVIDFDEDRDAGFTAFASSPIEVENKALGYKISYDLKLFTSNTTSFFFKGSILFKELEPVNEQELQLWVNNRKQAYDGSPRHLFQSLLLNNIQVGWLQQQGFTLYTDKEGFENSSVRSPLFKEGLGTVTEALPLANIVGASYRGGLYRISAEKRIEVHYLRQSGNPLYTPYKDLIQEVSWLEVKDGFIDVTKDGLNQRPDRLVVSGAMSEGRVSYMLPSDYQPERQTP